MDRDLLTEIIIKEIPDAKCSFGGDSCNLKLIVSSASFQGLSLINQHKKVLNPLKDKFESGVLHALSIETRIG